MDIGDKKMQIVAAAETLFAEKGFKGTSVRDIAERAGVNLAMISYYFGSKDQLLEALFELRGEETKKHLQEIVDKPKLSALARINLLIDNTADKFVHQTSFNKIMVREQVIPSNAAISKLILNLKIQNYKVAMQLLKEGQKSGEIQKNIDPELLMSTIIGILNHFYTSQQYYRVIRNMEDLPDAEFQNRMKKRITHYLKFLIKKILTNEE